MKKGYMIAIGMVSLISIVSAANIDTIITYVSGGQQAATQGSSNTRIMTVGDRNLSFINKNNDSNSVGDYFSGYYYDPAYGFFQMNASPSANENVRIVATQAGNECGGQYDKYRLGGSAYNSNFGFVNFDHPATGNNVYICIPKDGNDDSISASMHGYAYSEYIGFQNFDGIQLDSSVDIGSEHDSDGRFLKVEGNTSSQNTNEVIADQFTDDVRVIGNVNKSTLKKDLQQNVYSVIRDQAVSNGGYSVSNLASNDWGNGDGAELVNGKVLYFGNLSGRYVTVGESNSIAGEKTLVVEGGDIYITGNLRGSGILGLVALSQNNVGGNIYIHPDVTDVHAIMYADKSLVSARDTNLNGRIASGEEFNGATQADQLVNQLYIKGSIFSENTIGGSLTTECPYYVSTCNDNISKKYDLNYLRRYILVQPVDTDGNPVGDKRPQFNGLESFMGDSDNANTELQKPGYRKFPMVIEYDSRIQQTPPPFFD